MLIKLETTDGGKLRLGALQIVAIYEDEDSTRIETTGRTFRVKQSIEEIDAIIDSD